MAERSKASDSSSDLSGGVGSNPTECIILLLLLSSLVQLVRISGFHPDDPGSNPGRGNNYIHY